MPHKAFNPAGTGYDIEQARSLGFQRDASGHLPSRNPFTGQILKGIKHPTFDLAITEDRRLGFEPYIENATGRVFTFREPPDAKRFRPFGR